MTANGGVVVLEITAGEGCRVEHDGGGGVVVLKMTAGQGLWC